MNGFFCVHWRREATLSQETQQSKRRTKKSRKLQCVKFFETKYRLSLNPSGITKCKEETNNIVFFQMHQRRHPWDLATFSDATAKICSSF